MLLSNHHKAIIDIRKLEDYCLNPSHPRGKHKAKVFLSTLGITQSEAHKLAHLISIGISTHPCKDRKANDYGTFYIVDFNCAHKDHNTVVRTHWIIRNNELTPRLITCYVR